LGFDRESVGVRMEERKFKCLKSFTSEGRYCLRDEIYTAYKISHGWKFVFENGEMNFTSNLFERTLEDWNTVIEEVAE